MFLHIITMDEWNEALQAGSLKAPSLETERFIHCSYATQVLTPANERYAGRDDLFLLFIDPEQVTPPVVVEDSYGSGTEFPHIYGPLNVDAVVSIEPFPRGEGGLFTQVPEIEAV
jgi:uncharacterized protein (DUF952 family)